MKYALFRIENNKEILIMITTSLEDARKQGENFKNGYSIYQLLMVEYGN